MARIVNATSPDVDLEVLVEFERASWPEEERASKEMLQRRLAEFPEGIWVLFDRDNDAIEKPMAQLTVVPKVMPIDIYSFEQMRDLPMVRSSDTIWGVNLSKRLGSQYSGKMYAVQVVTACFAWAREQGYERFMAGVTCCGLKDSLLSPEEYNSSGKNPALRVFQRAAQNLGMRVEVGGIIRNYWKIDQDSLGMGVLITVYLKE